MGVIRFAIENPVKVAVGVILLILFGFLSIFRIPIQLTPDVDRPVISVQTFWRGASPQEIESEIVDRQEEKLKSVTNLKKMTSQAIEGMATIRLEFPVGVDKDIAFRDVSDKLRQVTGYPEEVDDPVILSTDNDMENTIAWMILYAKDGEDVATLQTFIEDTVKPMLERAEGISEVPVYGGRNREIQIEVDPYLLAARQVTFGELEQAVRGQNKNVSAGTTIQGKRDYTFRTVGEYRSVEDVENTVVAYKPGGPVFIRDVANVIDGFEKQRSFVRSQGRYVLALPARRETGANVMKAMENLKQQIELVNRTVLEPRGLGLELTQVYDETMYITSAIRLVANNILFGGVLAITILVLFLRSGSATGIIAVAIPISVIGTFLVITLLGRSLNVVMLAGMAFAVGMVVDNAIVVLENIFRHRSMGKSKSKAALDGAREVWGAVLASTLTTMAVFLPVIFIEEEAGQLFRDIAVAIAAAVGLSLIVSVLVIPPLAARFFQAGRAVRMGSDKPWRFAALVSRLTALINHNLVARIGVVVGFSGAAVLGSWLLMPATEYLPSGNQNLVFGILISPPGYTLGEFRQMALLVEEGAPDDPLDGLKPFWEASVDQAEHLPPVQMTLGKGGNEIVRGVAAPPIENFFFVAWAGTGFMGCTSKEPTKVKPLENVMARAASRIPGVFGGFLQTSLFQTGHGQGNSVDVEIRGENLNEVIASASAILRGVLAEGYSYPQPSPGNFDLGRPEYQIIPKRTQAADLGFDVRQLGFVAESCIDGAFVGEFNDKGDKIDMVIKVQGTERASLRELGEIPVYTSTGKVVPIASVVDVHSTTAPQQINHIEEMGSVTLSVKPKQGVPLQETMRELEEDVIAPLREGGLIDPSVITTLAGTADKLTQTQRALAGDFAGTVTQPRLFGLSVAGSLGVIAVCIFIVAFAVRVIVGPRPAVIVATLCFVLLALGFLAANPLLPLRVLESRMVLALLITYLLMAALFESFAYPFVIMFSVPLAAVGGFASLRVVHEISYWNAYSPIQQLDVLTMLGFVILIGIVVNNAILLVHQALNYVRDEGMDPQRAIIQSVQTRTRPIFMSALTSVFGMAPLVIMPGAGSELYRGLGSVVVGGLIVATVFTLVVVPSMFSLFISFEAWYAKAIRTRRAAEAETAPQPTPVAGSSEA